MATAQDVLNTMEILMPELQLQSGEDDVTHGLVIINRVMDMFETHAAQYADIFPGSLGNLLLTANQDYTDWPSTLLRLDGLVMLNDATSRPEYPLEALPHREDLYGHGHFPYNWALTTGSSGKPAAYWTDGTRIYWDRLPDAAYTVRWHGFKEQADLTTGGSVFPYPSATILPFAVVAVRLMKTGLDDPVDHIVQLGIDTFNPVLDMLASYRRDGPAALKYSYSHDT